MRNINFPFNSRPYPGGGLASFQEGDLVDEGGLASIIEGAETEEEEETTLEQIIRYLFQHSGILPEGMSLEGLLGGEGIAGLLGEEEKAHGGVVPGTNPIQGQKGGPTVGYNAPGGNFPVGRNLQLFKEILPEYKSPAHWHQSKGSALNLADPNFGTMLLMERMRMDKEKEAQALTEPAPTPDPVGPQSFDDLLTAKGVQNPIREFVVGNQTREQLYEQYFPPDSPAVQRQYATALPPLTEEHLLNLADLV